jgi:hypothetical protein
MFADEVIKSFLLHRTWRELALTSPFKFRPRPQLVDPDIAIGIDL